ncbi:MAG: sigma-70 family RNA polymerase sigma factor [Actinobacteria bacterium]|nr:sigma-70 family RNA polymerase sigma factor [Actinomycetota bacterium]
MNEAEFTDFYQSTFSALVRQIYVATGDATRAEECVQEAFVRAWMKRRNLQASEPRRWVSQVAWRLAIDSWRASERERRALGRATKERSPQSTPPVSLQEFAQELSVLTEEDRAVLILRHFEDLSIADVAELLNLPIGTVKSKLFRATEKLSKERIFTLE